MSLFSDASVKVKLILVSILSKSIALLVAGTVITSLDLMALREKLVRRMSIQADIVGANCLSALLFSDAKSAETTLAALKADPRIRAAGLYAADRRLFATYVRDPSGGTSLLEDHLGEDGRGHRLGDDRLVLWRSVLFDQKTIGAVVIVSDLSEVGATMTRDVLVFACVLLGSLLIALAISSRLQRSISQPILELAGVARKVTQDKDYSVRATGGSRDEIGSLVVAFNDMLEEIRQQEAELRAARDRLEQRVAERTAQLQIANKELESFSYSVSHDLRAPLRSIEGFSKALFRVCRANLDPKARVIFIRFPPAPKRMGHLIDDLFHLSRFGASELLPRACACAEMSKPA